MSIARVINYGVFTGEDVATFIPELAKLRIQVFREWPYLYEGDLDYEQRYLRTYIEAQDSQIILAFDEHQVVGAAYSGERDRSFR